jgi:hypothetical protein
VVVRVFRARVHPGKEGEFERFVIETGIAGPDWQKAVIEPEEEHMLAQVFCDHYETIDTG